MEPRPTSAHTLERINNDGNYEPDNCKWATQAEQSRNMRTNVLLAFNGQTKCIADWASDLNTSYQTLQRRLQLGWSLEKTLTTPVRPMRPRQTSAVS
jgi:hypothetical protein